ncbi:MAG: SGNH/GDSL hydrolase family protein [Clostridiaceae bacterium]
MITILCYGDSNTWGYNPKTKTRYEKDIIWTSVLKKSLGDDYEVIYEGLNGRTTVWDDPIDGEYKNGKKYLLPCIHSHKPIDLVVLFLGSNDLKHRFSLQAVDVAKGVEALVKIIKGSDTGPNMQPPKVLVVIPPPMEKGMENISVMCGGIEKSLKFSEEFQNILQEQCDLIDASKIIRSSKIDGLHLDSEAHEKLGLYISQYIKSIF